MTRRVESLVEGICGSADHPLAPALRRWAGTSRPFLAFAEAHASKIRKKARLAASEGEVGDLLAELAVAALLLRGPQFTVLYEPGRAAGGRSPDFEVTLKGHTTFHVEVTRLRRPDPEDGDAQGQARRLARVLGDKVGQFPAGGANLLAAAVPPGTVDGAVIPAAVRLLGGPPVPGLRPEAARAFERGRARLSAVLLCALTPDGDLPEWALWLHPGARHPLPPELTRALLRGGSATSGDRR